MVVVCALTCCRIDVRFRQCMHVQALITGCGYCTCNIASKTQPLLSFSRSRLPGTTQLPQPTTALVARLLSLMHITLMIIQVNVTDIHSV